ncbi:MAG: hypothetical protein FJY67_00750 [Calditrichaeota bacterium]|nr:hypothetical protein [Calditrichota bacterium]
MSAKTWEQGRLTAVSLPTCGLLAAMILPGCREPEVTKPWELKPENVRILIDEGAAATNDTMLRIAVTGEHIDRMHLWHDSLTAAKGWEDYSAESLIPVPRREGLEIIFGRFAATGGGTTEVLSDSIRLDFTARIDSLDAYAYSDTLRPGDEVQFVMTTGEPGVAEIEFGEFLRFFRLYSVGSGVFQRSMTIPSGVNDTAAYVIGTFRDEVGNRAESFRADARFVVRGHSLQPWRIAHLPVPDAEFEDVVYRHGYCYLSDAKGAFHVIEVADPVRPRLTYTSPAGIWANGMTLDERAIYLADDDEGVVIYGLGRPGSPNEVARSIIPGKVRDVALAGSYLFATCHFTGLWSIDVANVREPRRAFNLRLTNYGEAISISGRTAFVIGEWGLSVIDIFSPELPRIVAEIPVDGVPVGVEALDNRVILATESRGIKVFDCRDPASPSLEFDHPRHRGLQSLHLEMPYLYAGFGDGLAVLQAGQLATLPVVTEFRNMPPVRGMTVGGRYLYVACTGAFQVFQLY